MTPGARWAAAAAILDDIAHGMAAEKALTNWARRSRFAGSKDRAAIRDHVYDILRCWRSTAVLGGGETGRARVLGRVRQLDIDPSDVFTREGYALAPLSDAERQSEDPPSGADAWDLQDWVYARFRSKFGEDAEAYAQALQTRASVFLRVNTLKSDLDSAQASLAADGIETQAHPLSPTALEVREGARRIGQTAAYLTGLVELQDVASQAVVDALPLYSGDRVLDYCAGGGGKALAMAARLNGPVDAHDSDPKRMSDLPARAERAGARITAVTHPKGPYDLVLCDVPCSGSGAWRRAPDGKWRLTEARLEAVQAIQAEILDTVVDLVVPNGTLAYATCSIFPSENEDQIAAFLDRHPVWQCSFQRRFSLLEGGDGFYLALLTRRSGVNTR